MKLKKSEKDKKEKKDIFGRIYFILFIFLSLVCTIVGILVGIGIIQTDAIMNYVNHYVDKFLEIIDSL